MNRFLVLAGICACCFSQTLEQPSRGVTDPGVVTTRQAITPAGIPSVFQGRVYGVAWAGDSGDLWLLHSTEIYRIDWKNNRVVAHWPHLGTPGNQSIFADPATGDAIIGYSSKGAGSGAVTAGISRVHGTELRPLARSLGRFQPGALSISAEPDEAGRRYAVVPLVWENKVVVLDAATGETVRQIDTGIAPFAAVISRKGATAWVSNLGGRPPKPDEAFASPMQKPAEHIVVDSRGVAATGVVTRVNVRTGEDTQTIAVGLHPTALALDDQHARLYVANGNSDSVTVINTESSRVLRTIPIQPFSKVVRGIAPTAVLISPDGSTLYVACGGINAVAVIDAPSGKLRGTIPTGWYPNGLALDSSGKYLAVSSLLGAGSGWRDAPAKRFVHSNRGSVAVVPVPNAAQLASYSTAVAENNRMRLTGGAPEAEHEAARNVPPTAVPARAGEPSPIQYVVFIIKENRTYDQVLGDIPKGNGDPSLTMFGAAVTPNQHRLAEDFVLLDNLYATGETARTATSGSRRPMKPSTACGPAIRAAVTLMMAVTRWLTRRVVSCGTTQARARSVRIYGEFAGRLNLPSTARMKLLRKWEQGGNFTSDWSVKPPNSTMDSIVVANYPTYTTEIPDVARANIFLADLKRYEASGDLPNLILLQLPSNHTNGTTPGASTPKAMVADNDFALGQIVEGLSHSRFWPKMAIFIVEDDAQNGVDHVDGHRTAAFVASPYARRAYIDSSFYSHQSILKTIELILGLPTMSIFDLIANDMRASFTEEPDLKPFTAIRPEQDLFEQNPPVAALSGTAKKGALASASMNWRVPDAAPTERLNRILWGAIKGWDKPYPAPQTGVFSPLSLDVEDEDREKSRP